MVLQEFSTTWSENITNAAVDLNRKILLWLQSWESATHAHKVLVNFWNLLLHKQEDSCLKLVLRSETWEVKTADGNFTQILLIKNEESSFTILEGSITLTSSGRKEELNQWTLSKGFSVKTFHTTVWTGPNLLLNHFREY